MVVYSVLSMATLPFMMMGGGTAGNPEAAFTAMMPMIVAQTLLGSLALILPIPGVAAIYVNLRGAKEGVRPDSVFEIFG